MGTTEEDRAPVSRAYVDQVRLGAQLVGKRWGSQVVGEVENLLRALADFWPVTDETPIREKHYDVLDRISQLSERLSEEPDVPDSEIKMVDDWRKGFQKNYPRGML